MRYKYLPYTPSSKIDCPNCGAKKRFVRYLDTETGEQMPDEFGTCDRKGTCGYHNYPGVPESTKVTKSLAELEVPQVYIDKSIVEQTMANNHYNEFLKILVEKFGEQVATESIKKYYIGTSKNNGTAYFYVNQKKLVTSCKIILYDGVHRSKSVFPYYPFKVSDGYRQCLFGMHLIDKNKKIKVVESEKTALIASMIYPEVTWMSCGGSNGFTSAKCKIIKDFGYEHEIDLLPDCSDEGREAALKWQDNLDVNGIKSKIIDVGPEFMEGQDLADLILEG